MLELREWIEGAPFDERPWMMLGKGPSFAEREHHDLSGYNLLSLNHAVLEVPVQIAHVIDIDVVHDCESTITQNCEYLVIPLYPHVQARPGPASLQDYLRGSAALRQLDAEGRLVWYNVSTARPVGDSPIIPATFFGSEAALGVLGELGAQTVRSLGVDGGTSYASAFEDIADQTLLSNGKASFDMQFAELRKIARRYGIDYRPLIEPLPVFVGASPAEAVPYQVLAHSIHRHSSVPVRVEPLTSVRSPMPKRRENRPRTAFSFARFHIPELCDYRGRAVYVDSDMLVFGDIAELAEYPLGENWLACTTQAAPPHWESSTWFKPGRQYSVMILDCEHLDWKIDDIVARLDSGALTYEQLLFEMAVVAEERIDGGLDSNWNSLERLDDATRLIHYTVVPTQPWKVVDHPLGHVWMAAYRDAVRDGAVRRVDVERLVRAGGRRDLLDAFDEPSAGSDAPARNVAEVALEASLRELDAMRSRTARGRLQSMAIRVVPTIDRVASRHSGQLDISAAARKLGRRLLWRR